MDFPASKGAGTVAAVGNGNAATTESFIASQRKAFNGLCMLIVKAGDQSGTISITAESDGLQSDRTNLDVQPPTR